MRILTASIVAAVLVTAAGFPAAGVAGDPNGATSPSTSGMRVYRDPVTGELVAPPENEAPAVAPKALEEGGMPAAAPLVVEPSAAGGVKVRLDESHQQAVRATKDAAGKTELDCVRGSDADQVR
jgi:hypothetical protein